MTGFQSCVGRAKSTAPSIILDALSTNKHEHADVHPTGVLFNLNCHQPGLLIAPSTRRGPYCRRPPAFIRCLWTLACSSSDVLRFPLICSFFFVLTPAVQLRLERSCLDSGPFDHPTLTVGAKVQIAALIGSVCAVSLLSGTNCRAWLI